MPWREGTKVELREKLIRKWLSNNYTVTELAEEFGVSRPTIYTWVRRFEDEGINGLVDRPPIPKDCPHRTSDAVAQAIVSAKSKFPHWGPSKLIDRLKIDRPDQEWPAPSTAARILDSRGMVAKRQPRRSGVITQTRRIKSNVSGEVMTADHKGQFRLLNGQWCYPVTIADPVSRYVYAISAKTSTSYQEAKQAFVRVFREHGLPSFMATDNGNPFCCSRALASLSRLTIWWIKLGIEPIRIRKGCPWENGIHERMHKTLKAETTRPPAKDLRAQQRKFDRFRHEYNTLRPHQGLSGRTPHEFLKRCARSMPSRLMPVEYPAHYEVRSIRSKGDMKWRGRDVFVSQALIHERVGLVEIDDGVWSVYFSTIELGRYDERTKSVR